LLEAVARNAFGEQGSARRALERALNLAQGHYHVAAVRCRPADRSPAAAVSWG
jgi:hypothetical protein